METTPIKKAHARVEVADVLRGFAVMGIIVLHSIEHFNFYSFPDTASQGAWLNFADKAVWDSLFFLFGGKAYAIFALLFGFSFFIQDDNQRMRGKDFRLRFCWRLVLLFLIGNVNAMFFTGEILVMYSILGFILVLTCRLPDKWVAALACLFLLQPLQWVEIGRALCDAAYVAPAGLDAPYWAKTYATQTNGTFREMLRVNLWEGQLASLTWAWGHGRIFQTMALFMLGMLMGRREWLLGTEKNFALWGRVLAVALMAFFPLYGLVGMLPQFVERQALLVPLSLIASSLANFAFMLVLVCGVLFAFYHTRLRKTLSRLMPYGKMSLTNYITQSIFGSMLFYNWGFSLYDDLGITASFCFGILLFLLQYSFCRWWMSRHSHGPMELLWKKGTWIGGRKV